MVFVKGKYVLIFCLDVAIFVVSGYDYLRLEIKNC